MKDAKGATPSPSALEHVRETPAPKGSGHKQHQKSQETKP